MVREGVPLELNEFDVYAVTEAIRLRDEHGGEVVTMTMGPPQAEDALRMTLAMGADRAIHLNDKVFAVADTLGTSRTLAMAVAKEGADLVICGRKTVDSETWQVPPETAAFLGWPQLTSVDRLALADGRLRGRRETDEGYDTYELETPALVSVAEGINEGIWPARRDVEATPTEGRIAVWTAADLVDEVEEYDKRFGQTGSPTRVLAVKDATPERGGEIAESPQAAAERIVELLRDVGGPAGLVLGEAGASRDEAGRGLRLLDGRRSGRRRAAPRLSGAARQGPRAGGQARRAEHRAGHRPRPGRRRARGRAIRRRTSRRGGRRAPGRLPPGPVLLRASPGGRIGAPARAPHPLDDHGPRLWAPGRRGARARHDRRLRRSRHRQGRAPDPVQARLRRQHRLGDHGRDHATARDRTSGDVRARRAQGRRRGRDRRAARRRAGRAPDSPDHERAPAGHGRLRAGLGQHLPLRRQGRGRAPRPSPRSRRSPAGSAPRSAGAAT